KAVKASSGSGMFATGLTWFFEKENREQKVIYKDRNQFASDVEFVIENQFAPDCMCINRSILDKYQFNAALYINEDLELWGRIATEYPVTTIKENTAVLRVHSGNTSQTEKDYITPRIEVFEIQLANSEVRSQLSNTFIKNRWRSLRELSIRHQEATGNRWQLVFELIRFLTLYPRNPRNKAKLVTLIYNLPGGFLIKRIFGSE
ncbi:MAG: hypothetical protein QF371_07085, partial [Flavobacteriales bacterium]|nr:hypothetical protein [Flavobacteriales bacterium]